MKHILLTILACFAISMAAQAQLSVGIKAGIGASNVDVNEVKNNPWQYKDSENITGYHAGAFARLQILGIFVQPEAVLSSTGGKVDFFNDQTAETTTEKFKFTRLDVPLLAGINLFNVARVQAGPVASVLLSARQEGKTMDNYLQEADWGWQAGVGVDISRLTLDLRYERVNRNYTNDAQQSSYELANKQVLLSVGYKLFQ
ncbi:porin family protein [Pontibacter ruber]|uniref:Porin family protein n=1 Tax=Pontibacter ruber TaxID=1343895 RepID=A0ABW5D1D0_9BACT|nr:porin family protein [Pontibacter ruber]